MADLHPIAVSAIKAWLSGDIADTALRWYLSMLNSDYIALSECIITNW